MNEPKIAIIDYGLCNMFSVKHACEKVGMEGHITDDHKEILNSDAVILPGVGAFADAMEALKQRDLVSPLKEAVASGKPFFGICLGHQLLMSESEEFGHCEGLGFIEGTVKRFDNSNKKIRVPHVGWNEVHFAHENNDHSPLAGIPEGAHVYFCHSYCVEPEDDSVILSRTRYGDYDFCSSLYHKNITSFQFHPEKSGPVGMQIYKNILNMVLKSSKN